MATDHRTTGVVVTDEQILAAVALTLATKAAEGLAEGGKAAFAALATLVRRRFEGRPTGMVALVEAEADPSDRERVRSLQGELEVAVLEDPEFGVRLQALWRDFQPHLIANADGVVNNVTGTVGGSVVQARDVHGGISFGNAAPPKP
jgi:hypothetical protein